MKYQSCWLRKSRVIIPAIAKTPSGILVEVEPIEVIDPEPEAFRRLVSQRLAQPMRETPDCGRYEMPVPVVLSAAGVKTWAQFIKLAAGAVAQELGSGWLLTFSFGGAELEEKHLPATECLDDVAAALFDGLLLSQPKRVQ